MIDCGAMTDVDTIVSLSRPELRQIRLSAQQIWRPIIAKSVTMAGVACFPGYQYAGRTRAHMSCLQSGVARSDRGGTIMLLNHGLLYSRFVWPLAATLSVIRWTLALSTWGINRCGSKKRKNLLRKWSRRDTRRSLLSVHSFGSSARGQSCLGIIKGCARPFGPAFRFMGEAGREPPPPTPTPYVCHATITIECSHPLLTPIIANMCSIATGK